MVTGRIAILGAGMAGLVCADRLICHGAAVTVFDKSGDIGGRLASRRRRGVSWNHGAPAVRAGLPEFRAFLDGLRKAGSAASVALDSPAGNAYVGRPDMRELLRPLAAGLDLRLDARVVRLLATPSGWRLELERAAQPVGPFEAVLSTLPGPQAVGLLQDSGIAAAPELRQVTMTPQWALLLGFPTPVAGLRDTGPGAVIERLTCQAGGSEAWVAHASVAWTRRHLEVGKAAAAERLAAELAAQCGVELPTPSYLAAHRWRFARTGRPLGRSHLWLPDAGLGFAGDWCLGPDAESAFLSGAALARAVRAI